MRPDDDQEIVFRDPPAPVGRSGTWIYRLAPLLERPEEWARVRVYSSNRNASVAACQLRRGDNKLPPGRWQFVARKLEVYARYMGS